MKVVCTKVRIRLLIHRKPCHLHEFEYWRMFHWTPTRGPPPDWCPTRPMKNAPKFKIVYQDGRVFKVLLIHSKRIRTLVCANMNIIYFFNWHRNKCFPSYLFLALLSNQVTSVFFSLFLSSF